MKTPRFFAAFAHAAAVTGLLLLASGTQVSAGSADGVKAPRTGNKTARSETPITRDHRDRIIRDHRGVERTDPRAKPKPICAGWAC